MLQNRFQHHKIILGSQSPRRKQLLEKLDLDFEVQSLDVDEVYSPSLQREEITHYLCAQKKSAYKKWQENHILITSDTIVWHKNKAFGKPSNASEAMMMLDQLSGQTHEVITSVGVFSLAKKVIFSDVTKVSFKKLSQEEIEYYVTTYKPFDKAGAYGIQEWIGAIGIEQILGSYYNVMGLPIHRLYEVLKEF